MIAIGDSLSIVRVIERNIYSTGNHRTWGSINCKNPLPPKHWVALTFFCCSSFAILFSRMSMAMGNPQLLDLWVIYPIPLYVGYIPNTIICGLYTQYHWIWGFWPYYHYIPIRKTRKIWQKPLLVGQAWSTPPNFPLVAPNVTKGVEPWL